MAGQPFLERKLPVNTRSWIHSLFARNSPSVRKDLARFRPRLDLLENRLAPATLIVNSAADTAGDTDAYLSLREAVAIVNSATLPTDLSPQITAQINGTLHAGGVDTIGFDPSAVTGPITLGGTVLELSLPSSTAAITIDGGSAGVTIDGAGTSGIFQVDVGVAATFAGLTLTHGNAVSGGAIWNSGTATVTGCTLADNTVTGNAEGGGGAGGGIFNRSGATLTVSGCTLTGNTANVGPSSVEEVAGSGGGIFNLGTATVAGSTLTDNTATSAPAVLGLFPNTTFFGNGGGGICNAPFAKLTVSGSTLAANHSTQGGGGGISDTGNLTVEDSTLTGNTAVGGGGIFEAGFGTVEDSTLTGNTASQSVGGIEVLDHADLGNVLIVGNAGGDVSGSAADEGGNLIGVPAGLTLGQVIQVDAGGNPLLADNGGPTQTVALAPGSPAIGAGAAVAGVTMDQRGVLRADPPSIGAYEGPTLTFGSAALDLGTTPYGTAGTPVPYTVSGNAVTGDVLVTAPAGVELSTDSTSWSSSVTLTPSNYTLASTTIDVRISAGASAGSLRGVLRNTGGRASERDVSLSGTVTPATPTVQVTDVGGAYNGSAFSATATAAGLDGIAGPSLEGVAPMLTYYAGSSAGGTPLAGAPVLPGTYTALASFAGSADYTPASATATFTIQTPTTLMAGPTVGVPGQPLTYTFAVGGPTQGITFTINYGDGTSLQTGAGGPSIKLDHLYTATGSYTIQVTATDQNGLVSLLATQPVQISTVALEPDPSGGTALAVGGNVIGGDVISVSAMNTTGTAVKVKVNLLSFGPFTPTGHILVYGQGGHDKITLSPYAVGTTKYYLHVPAFLYGEGSGGDTISAAGSAADNVLTGHGAGEILTGGRGRDLLIGGTGAAALHAGLGDDILIGGWTDFDPGNTGLTYGQKLAALEAVMAEWGSTDPYTTRLAALAGYLSPTTVHDNSQGGVPVADKLAGNSLATDWFFAGANDSVTGKNKNDVITRIP
jgi:hypothetical protein